MALPYGIDYLKDIVNKSLGSNDEPQADTQSEDDVQDGGKSMYGLPPALPAMMQGTEQSSPGPYNMGPRFQAMAKAGGMAPLARAAGPVASAAVSGVDSILPGSQAALQGVSTQAGGKRSDFTNAGPPANLSEYLARLGHYESGNNPLAYNKASGASGMHQYIDKTWNNYGGYKSAKDAPAQVQFQRAMEDTIDRLKHNNGDLVKATLTHFLGAKGLQRVLDNPQKLYEPVNAENHDTTPFSYGAGILGTKVMQDWATNHHSAMGADAGATAMPYNLPANGMASASPQG